MPRELAASPRPRPRRPSARKRRASACPPAREDADGAPSHQPTPPPEAQEAALSEIRHELGNFFHKLYYWLDTLGDAGGASGDGTAVQMAEQTIRNLEEFLGTALEYFRPVTLTTTPMTAHDVVAGVCARVRGALEGEPPSVETAGRPEARTVLVDPGRFPDVIDAALQRLVAQSPAGTPVRIAVTDGERGGVAGLALALALGDAAPRVPAFHTAAATLAWATAQRVAVLHGGELSDDAAPDGARTVVLFLPYHA